MAAAAILNLFESKIAPLDPPSPKTHPITKHEVDRTTGCGDMANDYRMQADWSLECTCTWAVGGISKVHCTMSRLWSADWSPQSRMSGNSAAHAPLTCSARAATVRRLTDKMRWQL